jgi:hypothetical protein
VHLPGSTTPHFCMLSTAKLLPIMSKAIGPAVVADSPMIQAYARMAAQEGLLSEKPNVLDGAFLADPSIQVPKWIKEQVLEQAVLTPTFLGGPGSEAFAGFFKGVEGPLIDDGLLQPIESVPNDEGERIAALSEEIIFGMLKARSVDDIPQDEVWSRMVNAVAAEKAEEGYYKAVGPR